MTRPTFSRLLPELCVTDLVEARETFLALGFEIESGSAQHAIMVMDTLAVRLTTQGAAGQDVVRHPAYMTLEMSGTEGLKQYRETLLDSVQGVSNVMPMGWGKDRFTVTLRDKHVLTFTQCRPVYQG